MKKKLFFVFTAWMLCVLLAGCSGSVGSFERNVRSGNYQKAADLYNDKIQGNGTRETECESFLAQYMEDNWNAYQSGKLTGEKLSGIFRTLNEVSMQTGLYFGLDEYQYLYLVMEDSHANFDQAEQYMKDGEYVRAVRCYALVSEEDTINYETAMTHMQDAKEAYEAQVMEDADKLLENGDFTGAIDTILEAEDVVGETDQLENYIRHAEADYEAQILSLAKENLEAGQFSEAISIVAAAEEVLAPTEQFEAFLCTAYLAYYLSAMEDRFQAGDYPGVRDLYTEAADNSYDVVNAEMTALFGKSQAAFEEQAMATAKEAFGEDKDYTAAIQKINAALEEYGETEVLLAALEQYQSYAPVNLLSLDAVRIGKNLTTGSELKDVLGTTYDSDSTLCRETTRYSVDDEGRSLYCYLNSAYSVLTGTIYRPASSLECTTAWEKPGTMEIYGDGVLLYTSPDITLDTYDPIEFSVSVSGVRELRLMLSGLWEKGAIGLYRYPKLCVANLFLQK